MIFENDNLRFEIITVSRAKRVCMNLHTLKKNVSVLSFRVDGDGYFSERSRVHVYHKNDVAFIPENASYSQYTEREEIIFIHLKFENYDGEGIEIVTPRDGKIKSLFEETYLTWLKKNPGYIYKCRSLVNEIFYLMHCSHKPLRNISYSKIEKSVQYMYSNFLRPELSITELAAKSGISEVYFRKLFAERFGSSPLRFINRLRIDHAKALLISGEYSITEVAVASGFISYTYFYECFKKHEGKSPSEYIGES